MAAWHGACMAPDKIAQNAKSLILLDICLGGGVGRGGESVKVVRGEGETGKGRKVLIWKGL